MDHPISTRTARIAALHEALKHRILVLDGAMGKTVWILLPFSPDWRWLLDRPDSPWYPTARLFRQRRIADWAPVIDEVAAALADLK